MGYYDIFSEEKRRKGRKLTDIEVEEVSLVDQPANRARFSIIKRAEGLKELLKGFDASKMSEDAGEAVKEAVRILLQYKEEFPAEVLKSIQTLAAFVEEGGYPEKGPDGGPLDKRLGKSGKLRWPSFTISKGGSVDRGGHGSGTPGDDDYDFPERVPLQRGSSRQARGQGDQSVEDDKELWPSI